MGRRLLFSVSSTGTALGHFPGFVSPAERLSSLRRAASSLLRGRHGGSMLNRFDRSVTTPGEAEVKYLDGDFRVVKPGAFVRCAVTGVPIPLEELKYWSVDLQEAYVSPEAVMQRHHPSRAAPKR
jgi:hypothetical protein